MKRFNIHLNKLGEDPSSDWNMCLCLFSVALIAVVLVDAFLYSNLVQNASQSVAAESSSPTSLNKGRIERAVQQAREDESSSAVVPPAVLRDPSLSTASD